MTAELIYRPKFESLKDLLLDMAQERSADVLPELIVRRLAGLPQVALGRIWLLRPGDICSACPMRAECPDRASCLHLVASAGRSKAETGGDWSRLDGGFRRFPLGVRKVGHIAATGESVEVSDLEASDWIDRPDWAQREGVRGFMGQPLLCRGDILGVLAIFMRIRPVPEVVAWLRTIADHAAAALSNARAFEEIERQRGQLEQENAGLRDIFERALIASRPDSPHTDLPRDQAPPTPAGTGAETDTGILTDAEMKRRERENILAALRRTGWKIYGPGSASELLGIKPTTLASRIQKMGLKKSGLRGSPPPRLMNRTGK